MSDLILTSYLENNQLKTKIVKDSEDFWCALVDKLKQRWNRNTQKSTVNGWKEDNNIVFAERVLEHVAYWVLVKRDNLTGTQAKNQLKELDLYQRVKLVEHLF